MYDTILVPTDGSEGAEAAAQHARNLATVFDSEIHLLSVVDNRMFSSDLADLEPMIREQREGLEEQATEFVAGLEELFTDTSITCRTVVEHGIPHEVIRRYAREHDLDLIAMGTHGRTGLDRLLLGSVTERVVRSSPVPVLSARLEPREKVTYDRILIPTDGSESANAAIDHGLGIADRFDATVHALSVVNVQSAAAGSGVPYILESLEEDCGDAVAAVEDRGRELGIDVVTEVVTGTPYRAIQDYIDTAGIDLVVMGTQGRTGLERYILGSVTERTVRTSDAPVLTVRQTDDSE